jgi:hypothetical protein
VQHCTVVPDAGGIKVKPANDELMVELVRTISGTIQLPESVKQFRAIDSIVQGSPAVQAAGAWGDLQGSTFLGKVSVRLLKAGNCIFTGQLEATLRQAGCLRFSFVPPKSATPRRYRCQPDLSLAGVKDPAQQQQIVDRLTPVFASVHFTDPAYAQLKRTVPEEIRAGADDGAEMGAFYFLKQPQREANLRASLDEFLRFGLEAGIYYAT